MALYDTSSRQYSSRLMRAVSGWLAEPKPAAFRPARKLRAMRGADAPLPSAGPTTADGQLAAAPIPELPTLASLALATPLAAAALPPAAPITPPMAAAGPAPFSTTTTGGDPAPAAQPPGAVPTPPTAVASLETGSPAGTTAAPAPAPRTAAGQSLADWEAQWRTAGAAMPSEEPPQPLVFYDPQRATAGTAPAPEGSAAPGTPSGDLTSSLLLSAARTPAPTLLAAGAASLAAATSNPITLENQKPGTPESVWMIGAADSTIEGFAAEFTLNHGQTVDFKINTDSKNYRIDIYRLGYYGGNGARQVATINRVLPTAQTQPVPLFDPATRLVDAGNWSVSASWAIPADAVSGVYFAELTRLDGSGGQNIIPFIVRDDDAPSDITFQTSDTTWQAYNWWGGYNLYGGVAQSGREGRASAVSYNRPIITRDGGISAGPQDFIFGEEYPAIRWLEQNGYDVNYISGIDTARSAAQLLNSKIFLSVGHDEYWSADQRANVEAARDAGVNLAFLSGNEVYWETRWAPSIDGSGTPYKTLVSYKERWDNANSDTQGTTSTWRDPQYGAGQPENALSGTMFTVDAYRQDTITIPYDLSNFRFWSNTAVANLQPNQVYSLTPNLLGYEWDSSPDNGFRPAGLINLSSSTVNVDTLLLDYGTTTGSGTATHNLTLYRAPSGALVFGAGTVYWSWGLDSHHDNEPTPTDPNVQQAMVNLFADMGVQPVTLMQSLAVAQQTTDHSAPTSVITSPTASGSYTAAQPITITGTATDTGGGIVAAVEVSTDNGASWHRATGFGTWSYSWMPLAGGAYTIRSRAVDDSVNLETPGAGTTITVAPGAVTSLFRATDTPVILAEADPSFVTLGVRFTAAKAGSVVALRYYRGLGDGGTHIGSLWSSSGTLLASATYVNETQSGWQTAVLPTPVALTAGATYYASYHSNGGYADTDNYFTAAHTSGPLTAGASNGYYVYGNTNAFPSNLSSAATNYFVDVVFSAANTTNSPPVASNDSGFTVALNTPITIQPAALLANDTDPDGDPLTVTGASGAAGGSVSFNAQTGAITFTPTTGYIGPASFGYAIADGRGGVSSATVSLDVGAQSLFSAADTPAVPNGNDAQGVNLGVRFSAAQAGSILGIRYYKGSGDTGTHVGALWSATGTLLASATFSNESASGWQTVSFASPVAITAGTSYVASYHSNGNYATTANYFTSPRSNGVLTAPTGNGLYAYGSGNAFPTSTYQATNYWVDVLYAPAGGGANQPPVANNDSGFTTPQNTALQIAASALTANDTDPNGDPLTVTGVSGASNGTAVLNGTTITFTPASNYTGNAGFTYAISDGRGGTASASVALTVAAVANQPPVANNDSGFTTPQNTALQIAASALTANDTDPNGDPLTVTGVSGASNGTAVLNGTTVTFTPASNYTGNAGFTYAISDGRGGTASASVALTVTAPLAGVGLFAANATPATITASDPNPVELGMKFTLAQNGTINGIRFYKGPQNTGTHTGALWTAGGTQLGSLTFSNETASGWQTASFTSPIAVSAGTTYVVGYHSNGFYSVDANYFATTQSNGPVSAPSSASSGGNGVYAYGSASAFPTSTYNASNYWVDVLYAPAVQGPNNPPVANNDSGFVTQQNTALQIAASALTANDTDADGDPLTVTAVSGASNGTAVLNGTTVTFTPASNYTGNAGFSYTIADGRGGTASASVALAVTAPSAGVSLFAANATPATITASDPNPVELGMKFTASQNGTISGIRFYKGPQNTGTHTGALWTATGTQLGSLTFSNETASGWQTASFATPISVTANTTYVVGYHSNGFYSANSNYFATTQSNGPLTAPSSASSGGNGVYAYGTASAFPANTFNATNYWVDVIFNPLAA